VIEGRLWAGVLRRTHDDLWICSSTNAAIFGEGSARIPDAEILWDMRANTWAYTSPGRAPAAVKEIRAVTVGAGTVHETGERLLAVVEAASGAQAIDEIVQSEKTFSQRSVGYGDLMVTMPAIVILRGRALDGDSSKKIAAEELVKASEAVSGTPLASYEKIGDTLIAPWSIDLGPVGLLPARPDAKKAIGHWESAGSGLDVHAAAKPPPVPLKPRLTFPTPRPSAQEIKAMESNLDFDPDGNGVHSKTYGWSCGMGHGDHPGFIYWFVTQDDRLVRILYPAYCDGGGPRPPEPRIDVYLKN
jgi:hypothetical protein